MTTVFGPVPSRRLGRSLGIDVVPPKTCSMDCVYCESGPTTCLTLERKPFVEPGKVLRDLDTHFSRYPQSAEVLTFSSAGEPTLYEPLGELIRAVKKRFPVLPVIVLTNGSLLWDSRVRADLTAADRVVPSLDAVSEEVFQKLNRPHGRLTASLMLEGLEALAKDYSGQLHVEVMLVSGMNDTPQEMEALGRFLRRVDPERVELNTVVRPPSEPGTAGLSPEAMQRAARFFPEGISRIIGRYQGGAVMQPEANLPARMLSLVKRRPCTMDEMILSLGVSPEEAAQALKKLEDSRRVGRYALHGREYICPRSRT